MKRLRTTRTLGRECSGSLWAWLRQSRLGTTRYARPCRSSLLLSPPDAPSSCEALCMRDVLPKGDNNGSIWEACTKLASIFLLLRQYGHKLSGKEENPKVFVPETMSDGRDTHYSRPFPHGIDGMGRVCRWKRRSTRYVGYLFFYPNLFRQRVAVEKIASL